VRLCALGHGIADREPALELAQVDGAQALGRDLVGERGDEAGVALRGWEQPGEELRVRVRGERMAQLTKGYLLAPLHFMDERTPTQPRFNMPFFLRARQHLLERSLRCLCLFSTAGTDSTSAASQ
jgi:hypothetical protein